jgi:competence protein ComEA
MTNIEDLVYRFRWQLVLLLLGLILASGGVFLSLNSQKPVIEIVGEETGVPGGQITVELSGAVKSPGVYKLDLGSRVEDLLAKGGSLTEGADAEWVEKYLNRASVLIDGQKIYIPDQSEQSGVESDNNAGGDQTVNQVFGAVSEERVNINTASQNELEALYGIGPVYAKKIIDNRPYSNIEELLDRKIVTQKIYDGNRDLLSVY